MMFGGTDVAARRLLCFPQRLYQVDKLQPKPLMKLLIGHVDSFLIVWMPPLDTVCRLFSSFRKVGDYINNNMV